MFDLFLPLHLCSTIVSTRKKERVEIRFAIYTRRIVSSQAFVVFFNNQSPTSVKRIFTDQAHIELAHGTSVQAATYCKKDGGQLPDNQGKRNDKIKILLQVQFIAG
jgi:putative hemolysin